MEQWPPSEMHSRRRVNSPLKNRARRAEGALRWRAGHKWGVHENTRDVMSNDAISPNRLATQQA